MTVQHCLKPQPVLKWPPELSEEQRSELAIQAATYSLAHGVLHLPKLAHGAEDVKSAKSDRTLGPSSAIHAPISLFPSPFPRELFELANRLQKAYNVLYARVAMDELFLDDIFSAIIADDFIARLWRIWKDLRGEGITQVRAALSFRLSSCRVDGITSSPSSTGCHLLFKF